MKLSFRDVPFVPVLENTTCWPFEKHVLSVWREDEKWLRENYSFDDQLIITLGVILLFYKEGKDQNDPKSYRPISLLPTMGKLLEKLMTQCLTYFLKKTRQVSSKQFGFKDQCPPNIQSLFRNLLKDRNAIIPTNERVHNNHRPGIVLKGPALLHLMAEEALAQQYPANTAIQAFADDFLILAAAESERKVDTAAKIKIN
ncbi:hypothetical protein AVEN_124203-1 [Araneus ventricosus]|uniref:Reverse transcriptase domain-containing protein n=1 Tax=Araneus ventricosus TaxID=182803 RepID=A0A4Y2HTH8_ARAVE|nr:hypothetical protein AVEN_124203-1 [Araneus ventricosus]